MRAFRPDIYRRESVLYERGNIISYYNPDNVFW